jgi:hypothetical protein
MTKGELLAESPRTEFLARSIELTVSCSHATEGRWKRSSGNHCGYCVPCVIRRASIKRAGFSDATSYRLQDFTAGLKSRSAKGRDIRSFLNSASRVVKHPEIAHVLIHKSGPLPFPKPELDNYAKLYVRGMTEVGKLLAGVKVSGS